jgi:hypothetical protein
VVYASNSVRILKKLEPMGDYYLNKNTLAGMDSMMAILF